MLEQLDPDSDGKIQISDLRDLIAEISLYDKEEKKEQEKKEKKELQIEASAPSAAN